MTVVFVLVCIVASHVLAMVCRKREYSLEKAVGFGIASGLLFSFLCFVLASVTGYSEVSFFSEGEIGKTALVTAVVCAAFAMRCGQAVNS